MKELLRAGKSVLLDIDFYYGAWNHRIAEDPLIGLTRNMDHWRQGIVSYPERNSKDRINSRKKPAGHSILLVGYDDSVEVTTVQPIRRGSASRESFKDRTFVQKGVYYFKNSWGTTSFGSTATIDGVAAPGYGAIVQKHAHQDGQFFRVY